MSVQALGWLSSKLGININGRVDAEEKSNFTNNNNNTNNNTAMMTSTASNPFAGTASKFDMCLHKINDAVFGSDGAGGGGLAHTLAGSSGSKTGEEDVELDENGLPISKNWYYFDKDLNRWNVHPEAPARIREEFQRRLREEEEEREGRNVIPPPPPPPPPPQPQQQHQKNYQSNLPMSIQQPQEQQQGRVSITGGHPQGLFTTQPTTGTAQHRPQYAMPNYFETTTTPAMTTSNTLTVNTTMPPVNTGVTYQSSLYSSIPLEQQQQQPLYHHHNMQHSNVQNIQQEYKGHIQFPQAPHQQQYQPNMHLHQTHVLPRPPSQSSSVTTAPTMGYVLTGENRQVYQSPLLNQATEQQFRRAS